MLPLSLTYTPTKGVHTAMNKAAILAFLQANPHSLMQDIANSQPRVNTEALSKQVHAMVKAGELVAEREQNEEGKRRVYYSVPS